MGKCCSKNNPKKEEQKLTSIANPQQQNKPLQNFEQTQQFSNQNETKQAVDSAFQNQNLNRNFQDVASTQEIQITIDAKQVTEVQQKQNFTQETQQVSKQQERIQPAFQNELIKPQNLTNQKKIITLFIGPTGCGKGTHIPRIAQITKQEHIQISKLIQENIQKKSEAGKLAFQAQNAGIQLEDKWIIQMIIDKLQQDKCLGIILDGFPVTLEQAKALEDSLRKNNLRYEKIISFVAQDQILKERITGRWVHQPSGRIYNTKLNPPKLQGKDDITGENLSQNQDDTEEEFQKNLNQFKKNTIPLINYYQERGYVREIDASKSLGEVWAHLLKELNIMP